MIAFKGCAQFVAHIGEESGLCLVGRFGAVARRRQFDGLGLKPLLGVLAFNAAAELGAGLGHQFQQSVVRDPRFGAEKFHHRNNIRPRKHREGDAALQTAAFGKAQAGKIDAIRQFGNPHRLGGGEGQRPAGQCRR